MRHRYPAVRSSWIAYGFGTGGVRLASEKKLPFGDDMNVLIVHAHPEPKSFNTAMTQRAVATLRAAGHDPVVSDLYAMGFDPISDRRNFTTAADKVILNIQNEELFAVQHSGFTPLLKAEMDKLVACDLLIFQFPIWWLSLPAILKGWVDRVFACGVAYGGGRYFDGGAMRGRRAMCALTLGGGQQVYSDQGFTPGLRRFCSPSTMAFSALPASTSSNLSPSTAPHG
ncbi:NAD(P)H-dependent oxidoreductase [Hankyongella ginsenosidimutans]|uniref:NAD(P)H-dependent oxidoreductase n=1 Tax=Hankyongella ginsenosidimutans TaxID=1763828 RepID=UPI001CA33D72